MRNCAWIPSHFENATLGEFDCTSDRTTRYNCIAWAVARTDKWWWPTNVCGYYWPEGLSKDEETVENFIKAFELMGYQRCDSAELEEGVEKIALYLDKNGSPTHAARSLASGEWTSKLGNGEDISHKDLRVVEGKAYGKAELFFRRLLAS